MKYIHDTEPPVLELTRRNLVALLAKLDDPLSVRTLRSPGMPDEPEILVTAVEDAAHYGDRPAGDIYMPDAGVYWAQPAVAGYGRRLVELLADLEAQRWRPEVVLDLAGELRDVLGIPRDAWVFLPEVDGVDLRLDRAWANESLAVAQADAHIDRQVEQVPDPAGTSDADVAAAGPTECADGDDFNSDGDSGGDGGNGARRGAGEGGEVS